MRWLYLALTILSLWVAFNALFMLPGGYDAFNFWAAAVSIVLAVSFAWLGSQSFIAVRSPRGRRQASLWTAPPTIICIAGLAIIVLAGVIRAVWHRWP
jgi:hypothetical protein